MVWNVSDGMPVVEDVLPELVAVPVPELEEVGMVVVSEPVVVVVVVVDDDGFLILEIELNVI